jgi:hypothetical protein
MPMPVSLTLRTAFPSCASARTLTFPPPRVNFTLVTDHVRRERRYAFLLLAGQVTALGQLERHQITDVRVVVGYQDMSNYSFCDSWARELR